AETAGLIAWTRYMLEPQLEAFAPGFSRHVDDEITRRMLRPAVAKNYWWKKAGMNWNPWICSNWLTCVLICERDSARRTEAIGQIVKAMEAFTDAYPADGGCDEGTGYWDRAAASLYECIRLLRLATDGKTDLMTPKVRKMLAYIYKMYIGGGYCVNFADAHDNRMQAQPDIVLPIALDTQDPVMLGFAAHIARENNLFTAPAPLYDRSGNFPALGRELFMLREIKAAMAITPREPQTKDTWLPDLQVMTARRGRFFVTMKGGTNDESHNHNDVGNFIVYADGSPLIIDAGVGEYTSATFGKDRYSIWTMQSAYHNLPLINGVMQKDGRQYAAKVVSRKNGALTLDIAGAYPEEADVDSWKRTVSVKAGSVEVTEDYRLRECREPVRLMLLTTIRPDASEAGLITLGDRHMVYDARRLEASVEDISPMTDALLQGVWGKEMFRIVLTARQKTTADRLTYSFR
ncbi:MAG: heparinase II/III-family protein, partial [Prevotella sp.]|nr:heparinase II/III-family protein [Prevotella sp.]